MEFDVFVSHSSKDKTMADAVCAKLEQAGYSLLDCAARHHAGHDVERRNHEGHR